MTCKKSALVEKEKDQTLKHAMICLPKMIIKSVIAGISNIVLTV